MQTITDRKVKHITKYRHIQQSETLWMMGDYGNKDAKAMIHANFGEEIWFPNMVYEMQAHEWESQKTDHEGRIADYERSAIFAFDGRGYIVGDLAQDISGSKQEKGAFKYKREYLGALFVATALHLYPEGHKKINLVITHPAELPASALNRLRASFAEPFLVETADGHNIEYVVKKVVTIQEPVAAFQTYLLNTSGLKYQRRGLDLVPGMTFTIEDTGGFITHLALGKVNTRGEIELASTNIKPIEYGIHHVIERFNLAMRDKFDNLSNHTSLASNRSPQNRSVSYRQVRTVTRCRCR
jgi:hypothetical protein